MSDTAAFDVLVYKCFHCDEWVAECTRLAPLVGLPGFIVGCSKPRRVRIPVPGARPDASGRVPTMSVVKRTCTAQYNGEPVSRDSPAGGTVRVLPPQPAAVSACARWLGA
jgi:hypothetical protein